VAGDSFAQAKEMTGKEVRFIALLGVTSAHLYFITQIPGANTDQIDPGLIGIAGTSIHILNA